MFLIRSSLGRAVSVFVCTTLVVSQAAAGVNSTFNALLPFLGHFKWQAQTHAGPPMFTDQPTPIYYGDNPGRDESHRGGIWTDADLSVLQQQIQENNAQWGAANVGTTGRLALISLVGSGAGEPMSWEQTLGDVDSNTGNKLSTYPIDSWPIRGGGRLDFTLYQSSKSNRAAAAGYAWTMSYDATVAQTFNDIDQLTGANVYYDDGMIVHFTYHSTAPHYTAPAGIYDSLVQNTGGTWTLTRKDQTKWNFDANGYSSSWADRAGNTIAIGRNTSHYVTQLTDPTSRQLTIAYDASNLIHTITDPTSRVWTITHNTGGDITDIAYPSLSGTIYHRTFGYDTKHNITSMTDLRGKTWQWAYDTNDSCTSQADPLNHTTTYSYTTSACTMTLPGSETQTDNYTSGGLIASEVDAAGFSTAFSNYDSNNNAQTITDQRGKNWLYAYDSAGNLLTKKDPLLHVWTNTYNTTNDLLTTTDPLSHTTTYTVNSAGEILTITDALNRVIETDTYDSYGQILTSKNAMNESCSFGHDTNGNITTVTNPLGKTASFSYDLLGRVTGATDPLNHTTSMTYDEWERPTSTTYPGAVSSSTAYDNEDNILSTTNELGKSTTVVYDSDGRPTSCTNAHGDVVSLGYNTDSLRTTVTNGRNYSTTYTYTARGELASETLPDNSVEAWSYDGNGNTTGFTNALNQTISYTFDNSNRRTGIDYPTGTDVNFTYDNSDRLSTMSDSSGTVTATYDAASQLTSLATPEGNMGYTYENSGRRSTMTETGVGTTTYSYDSAGRLTSLLNPFSETTTYQFDDAGRLTSKILPSGAHTDYSYDSRNRVTSLIHKRSDGSTISSESYGYDDASNVASKTVDAIQTTYTYDVVNQLLSESGNGSTASYQYDANGNRTSKTVSSVTDSYTYDAGDKLTSVSLGAGGTKSYQYDAEGRTTSVTTAAGTTTLGYDYEGRISSITYPGSSSNSFSYGGLGARLTKTDSSGTSSYKHDGISVSSQVLSDGSREFTPGISQRQSSVSSYLHADNLGSITRMTDSSQTTTDTRQYDAFGSITGSSGSNGMPFGFVGSQGVSEDPDSGLKLMGYRYYDPSTGRFLTRDPARSGTNWYVYCDSNPTSAIDPLGLAKIYLVWREAGVHGSGKRHAFLVVHDDTGKMVPWSIGGYPSGTIAPADAPFPRLTVKGEPYAQGSKDFDAVVHGGGKKGTLLVVNDDNSEKYWIQQLSKIGASLDSTSLYQLEPALPGKRNSNSFCYTVLDMIGCLPKHFDSSGFPGWGLLVPTK